MKKIYIFWRDEKKTNHNQSSYRDEFLELHHHREAQASVDRRQLFFNFHFHKKKNLTFFFFIEKKSCIFLFHKKNSTFFLFIEKMLQFIFLSRRDGEALVEGLGGLVGHKHKVLDAVALAAAVVRGLALQACYVLQHLVQSFQFI